MKARVCVLAVSLAVLIASSQTSTQGDSKSGTASGTANTTPAEMKTMTYKGVLVDMSCASPASGSAATPESAAGSEKASSANRSANDSGAACPVTANSTELGMKLDDGKTVRFDLVGKQRAQDEMKNNKHWSKDIADGKPIHAKVSGVMSGEKLIVSSIH
jgi:hypothetical protein